MKESKVFYNVSGLNKAYEEMRADILERHNIKEGTKVRLKNAIMLYQNLNGIWIKMTSTKTDMIDKIKMYELYGKKADFKLVAMV